MKHLSAHEVRAIARANRVAWDAATEGILPYWTDFSVRRYRARWLELRILKATAAYHTSLRKAGIAR